MNPFQMLQMFQQFKNTFSGDPQKQVQQMLNSGQITQEQIDQAKEKAEQLRALFK